MIIPETCLILLVGPSSSGKSTFASKHFLPTEVISSDRCREMVADEEDNMEANKEAFELLHLWAAKRLQLGKLAVIDAMNIRREDRKKLIQLAKDQHCLAVAIVLENKLGILMKRHEAREDRSFGKAILEKQYRDFRDSLKTIKREGFMRVYFVKPEEELEIQRSKLWNNKKEETGPFDIIGDIHGCYDELLELVQQLGYETGIEKDSLIKHPEGRRLIFVGDLTDRGPKSPEVLQFVMQAVK